MSELSIAFAMGIFLGWFCTLAYCDKQADRSPEELYRAGYNQTAGVMLKGGSVDVLIIHDPLYLHPNFHKGVYDAISDFAIKRLTS